MFITLEIIDFYLQKKCNMVLLFSLPGVYYADLIGGKKFNLVLLFPLPGVYYADLPVHIL